MNHKSESDYYAWLRLRNVDDSAAARKHYDSLSGRRDHESILRRKRRQELGPGRLWAHTQSGWAANQHYKREFLGG